MSDKKTYHYIYKTTCLITDKFYIGMHSTRKLNDSYLGSGVILKRSVKKHGKENHRLEILEYCETRNDLTQREIEIINEDILKDPLCMNLVKGGKGNAIDVRLRSGWKMPPMTKEHRQNLIIARNKRELPTEETKKKMSDTHKNLPERSEEHKKNNRDALLKSEKFQAIMKSDEHRKLMSDRTKEAMKSSEVRDRIAETLKEHFKVKREAKGPKVYKRKPTQEFLESKRDPEYRKLLADRTREYWQRKKISNLALSQ